MAKRGKRKKKKGTAKLNITSMMDMFTIILLFLLKNFSSSGQLVTPADGLKLPISSTDSSAVQSLELTVSKGWLAIEGKNIANVDSIFKDTSISAMYIDTLGTLLKVYSEEGKKAADMTGKPFKGNVTIQGDIDLPYDIITKLMYTCGQSGFPNMNLVVYRQE